MLLQLFLAFMKCKTNVLTHTCVKTVCRFRASLLEALEYLDATSHGFVELVLTYQLQHFPRLSARVVLAGGAPSRSLCPPAGRCNRPHDWDFFCMGAWANVLTLLTGLFSHLGQHPMFSCFSFTGMTFTFYFSFPHEELLRLQFIMQAFFHWVSIV